EQGATPGSILFLEKGSIRIAFFCRNEFIQREAISLHYVLKPGFHQVRRPIDRPRSAAPPTPEIDTDKHHGDRQLTEIGESRQMMRANGLRVPALGHGVLLQHYLPRRPYELE